MKFVTAICIMIFVVYFLLFFSKTEQYKKMHTIPKTQYKIECINGHSYYKSIKGNRGLLAINLDDEGKPIPCQVQP